MNKNLYLIGFMGSGKSTISRILAKIFSAERIEMDDAIEEQEGKPIKDIFADQGEEYFRDVETAFIKSLQGKKNLVVSCGGGAVLRPENVSAMKENGRIILLTATPETIYSRVCHSTRRPVLNGNMNVEYISQLMEKRRPAYEAAADIRIVTDGLKAGKVAEDVKQAVLHAEQLENAHN